MSATRTRAGSIICCMVVWLLAGCSASQLSSKQIANTIASAPRGRIELRNPATSRRLPLDKLEQAAVKNLIAARFQSTSKITFFQRTVAGQRGAVALFGVSADAIYVACIKGQLMVPDRAVAAGQLILWTPTHKKGRVFHFNAEALAKSFDVPKTWGIGESLAQLAKKQQDALWWGSLRPTGINARASTVPAVDQVRRRYLLNPEVVRLRFETHTADELARGVIRSFLDALDAGDVQHVADLLSPATLRGNDDSALRLNFARAVANRTYPPLSGAILKKGSGQTRWRVLTGSNRYRVTLNRGDGLYYIKSFAPIDEPRNSNGAD